MTSATLKAGDLVKIGWRAYCHYAIVSDRIHDGKPMLISLSRRTGTVAEEPWDEVVRGRRVKPSRLRPRLSADQVLQRARNQIGRRRYALLTSNCEHFARESVGLSSTSGQVRGATGTGLSVLLIALRLARGHPVVAITATVAGTIIGSRLSAR